MRHLYILTVAIFVLSWNSSFAQIGSQKPINLSDPDEISYLQPKDYIIGGVTVSGAKYLDTEVLITISKLDVGQHIEVPSEATAAVIKDLMGQNLFEDVQLWATRIDGEHIFLEIRVQERPRLTRIDISGLSKSQTEEVNKRLNAGTGRIVNENLIQSTKNTIQRFLSNQYFLHNTSVLHRYPD